MSSEESNIESRSKDLEKHLNALAECEIEFDKAENDAAIYRLKKTLGIYAKRREILKAIPQFWYIVLAENEDFSDYIRTEDLKFLEFISDIYVHHKVVDTYSAEDAKYFSITMGFRDTENKPPLIKEQVIKKDFRTVVVDGEEKLESEPVAIEWPHELKDINPAEIKKSKDGALSAAEKKKYRMGMKSFFAWFAWTGRKPGKEFRNGEELARLIADDLYPYAVKYYSEALPGNGESGEDSSEGEELDLSESEDEADSKQATTSRKRLRLDSDEETISPKKQK